MQNSTRVILEDSNKILNNVDLTKFKDSKILILGGNSFLTSYIQSVLFAFNIKYKNNKCKVISCSKSDPKKHIKDFLKNDKNFKFIKLNLLNKKKFSEILNKKYNYIFFAATYGQPKKWMNNQSSTIFLNTELLRLLLEKHKYSKTRILFFSSVDVYGDTNNTLKKPVIEDYNGSVKIESPRAAYGESKRVGEVLCHLFKRLYKMNIYIVRPGHTYGPGMDRNDKRVIIDFIKKAEKGSINLLDQGKSIKTYGYISDIAEMFFNIIQNGKKTTYNTVGKNYISILNLAKLVSKQFEDTKIVLPVKKENKKSIHISSDPQNSIISSQRYCEEFGKKSFVSINDGIKKLIQYLSF